MKTAKLKIPRGRKSELIVSCQVVINPFCGLSIIFCGFISHLIGREAINIPEIFSGIHGFAGKTVRTCLDFFFPDFAVVARVKEKVDKNETEDNGKSKEPKHVTRGDVMQAMRQKCNQLIFQTRRPTYYKGEITEKFFSCYVDFMSIQMSPSQT